MVSDLYYFYESDLDRTNIKDFYDNLPCHLQSKFRASLHGIQIAKGNVLQGYRGPSNMRNGGSGDSQELQPSQGLQEIRYWWGARKDMNFVPVIGTGLFLLERGWQSLTDELEWSSLFFDSETGECLGHDRRDAAEKLKSRRRKAESKPQPRRTVYDTVVDSREQNERLSADLYDVGDAYFYEGIYCAAAEKFERALHLSQYTDHREKCYRKMKAAEEEVKAERLDYEGNCLFDEGDYIGARHKYEDAYDTSEQSGPRKKYARKFQKAQIEIDARERFHRGNRLFDVGRFEDAKVEYHKAYDTSNVTNARRIYRDREEKAQCEERAVEFNSEGDHLFERGRFREAESSYERAINISEVRTQIDVYQDNIAKASNEIYATDLNTQGNDFFNQGRYWAAHSKYMQADMASQVCNSIYKDKMAKAQAEDGARNLNAQGDNFFNQGNYSEAVRMYLEAHAKSKVSAQSQKYKANADRAKVEVDAANFNSQGDKFFNEGKFNDAVSQYQLACNTSRVAAQIQKYKANVAKAQVELDALELNVQGNNCYHAGRFNDAVKIYLEAYSKSQTATQKDMYLSNKNKAQDNINKLNTLATLWKQAWDVENDTKYDRSAEAKDLFQKISTESEENFKLFAGNSKFEQFKTLAVLKIEGNELFNEGVNSQENGVALFEEAQELNQQEKYLLANKKFKEANKYFQEALEKFEKGSKSDQRFATCVGFVQGLINEVMDSIKTTEQYMFSERLNKLDITSDNNSGAHSREINVTGKNINYSQHI